MTKRNKRFYGKSNDFKESSSKDKADDQKNCFNCKKSGHFKDDYPDLQKDGPKKGSF